MKLSVSGGVALKGAIRYPGCYMLGPRTQRYAQSSIHTTRPDPSVASREEDVVAVRTLFRRSELANRRKKAGSILGPCWIDFCSACRCDWSCMNTTPMSARTVLGIRPVGQRIARSRSWIFDKLNVRSPRHDPAFPKPVRLGQGARSPNAWYVDEIDAWLNSRQRAR